MPAPPHRKLRECASLAARAGDHAGALELYAELAELLPDEPTWLERCAGACQELGTKHRALGYLRRALAMRVDAGDVLPAIATCKQILELHPDDGPTLDTLHLLYTEPAMNPGDSVIANPERRPRPKPARIAKPVLGTPDESNAPLMELELTEMIPGARSVQIADSPPGGVSEIPLEESASGLEEAAPLDLHLDESAASSPGRRAARPLKLRRKRGPVLPPPPEPVASTPRRTNREALATTPLFGSLPPEDMRMLMERVRVVRLSAGDVLFREGDPANTLYVVVDGAVVPIAEGEPRMRLAVLETGEFFGEIGLVTNQPRNATVEALVDSRLFAIDRKVMWALIRGRPELSRMLLRFLRQRLVDRSIHTSPFFQAFARAQRDAVARQFRFLEVQDGTRVVEQGRAPEGLFVLLAGEMHVVDDARDKMLAQLQAGDLFGGIPIIRDDPAASSVVANGKCWVIVMNEPRLREILDSNPKLEGLLARLAKRRDGEPGLI